jgi:hypothetical protein
VGGGAFSPVMPFANHEKQRCTSILIIITAERTGRSGCKCKGEVDLTTSPYYIGYYP